MLQLGIIVFFLFTLFVWLWLSAWAMRANSMKGGKKIPGLGIVFFVSILLVVQAAAMRAPIENQLILLWLITAVFFAVLIYTKGWLSMLWRRYSSRHSAARHQGDPSVRQLASRGALDATPVTYNM